MLLDGWWRWHRCCCFSVQTGTTILGFLRLIGDIINFVAVCALANYDAAESESESAERLRQLMPLALTTGTKALLGIMAVIGIITSSLLIHGNFKNIAKIMKPAVYWWLACIVFNTILTIIGIVQLSQMEDVQVSLAPAIVSLILTWVIGLFIIQVIRCRIADVEEVEVN